MYRKTVSAALPRVDEHDTDLGVVTPDGLACSDGLAGDYEIEHRGNAGRSLNFQARASLGDIPNHTRDRMLSEDFNIRRRGGGCRLSTSVSRPHGREVGLSPVHTAIVADSLRRSANI
jgi:hypothetical protein